jgi:hypothetical protein
MFCPGSALAGVTAIATVREDKTTKVNKLNLLLKFIVFPRIYADCYSITQDYFGVIPKKIVEYWLRKYSFL